MNGFKVIGFKEAFNSATNEKTFVRVLCYYCVLLFMCLVWYSPDKIVRTSFFLWLMAISTLVLVALLLYGMYMAYNYEAIYFPEYVEREQEAVFLYSKGLLTKEYLLMRWDHAYNARNIFWLNAKSSKANSYGFHRHLERTLRKYPEYLQVEFKAYEHFHKHGEDDDFNCLLNDAMKLRNEYIKTII